MIHWTSNNNIVLNMVADNASNGMVMMISNYTLKKKNVMK